MESINDYRRIGRNIWKRDDNFYRLTGKGITPNGCWIIAPRLIELTDIDTATGNDVYGRSVIEFDVTGTVTADNEYIKR